VTYTETDDGFEIASPVTQAGERHPVIGLIIQNSFSCRSFACILHKHYITISKTICRIPTDTSSWVSDGFPPAVERSSREAGH